MFLKQLTIRNYKSLRNISFVPAAFSALIGPNAAGKSNFADSLHFLSEVYNHGLEVAISRKGGYENIAFRKQRRSKAPIEFEITVEIDEKDRESRRFLPAPLWPKSPVRLVHRFSVAAKGVGIKAAFRVEEEQFAILLPIKGGQNGDEYSEVVSLSKKKPDKIKFLTDKKHPFSKELGMDLTPDYLGNIGEQQLFVNLLPFRNLPFGRVFSSLISQFNIYQFSTTLSRASGVPTPNPLLSTTGENLPALVDWIQKNYSKQWEIVMAGMKEILPTLKEISVQYLHTKTLGLFFSEEGVGRPWGVDEVSDGTIHALAILVASADPRSTLLLIEEPENSVHSWILRVLVKRFREVSKFKNVLVTSHSPVLINLMEPEEIWVVFRKKGETSLQRLTTLDPALAENWKHGEYQLSELIDSGEIAQAVPGGVY